MKTFNSNHRKQRLNKHENSRTMLPHSTTSVALLQTKPLHTVTVITNYFHPQSQTILSISTCPTPNVCSSQAHANHLLWHTANPTFDTGWERPSSTAGKDSAFSTERAGCKKGRSIPAFSDELKELICSPTARWWLWGWYKPLIFKCSF